MTNPGTDPAFAAAVEAINDAALAEEAWPAALEAIRVATRSCEALLYSIPGHGVTAGNATCIARQISSSDLQYYYEQLAPQDTFDDVPWSRHVINCSHELLDDRLLERTAAYRDWYAPLGVYYHGGANLTGAHELRAGLAIWHTRAQGPVAGRDLARLAALIPAASRTVQVNTIVRNAAALSRFVRNGEATRSPIVFLDRLGTVTEMSEGAGRLFRAAGWPDCACARFDMRELAAASGAAIRPEGCEITLGGYFIRLAPHRRETFNLPSETVAAIVFAGLPGSTHAGEAEAASRLIALFALTRAEARVALAIGDGRTIQAIADAMRTSRETVRTQLKTVFQKTGVHRQTELAVLVRQLTS